jgi:hypothetical protein
MLAAIAAVELVGLVEARDDRVDAGRSVHRQRSCSPRDPALGHGLAEVPDVVRVEVSEEHARELGARQAPELDVLPGAGPDVHEVELPRGQDRDTARGAVRVGERRAGSAEDDVERAVREEIVAVALRHLIGAAADEEVLDLRASREQGEDEGHQHGEAAEFEHEKIYRRAPDRRKRTHRPRARRVGPTLRAPSLAVRI